MLSKEYGMSHLAEVVVMGLTWELGNMRCSQSTQSKAKEEKEEKTSKAHAQLSENYCAYPFDSSSIVNVYHI